MKILLAVGTRPEVIKMAGVVYELKKRCAADWLLCSTGQHRAMLDDIMDDLELEAGIDLDVMSSAQGLADVMAAITRRMENVLAEYKPDWVLVQGDTTTAFAAALAAYYHKIPVGHIEAGLRTFNRYSPWPEEIHRKMIGTIATRHFAPTKVSEENLLREGVPAEDIRLTGNTVIDVLLQMAEWNDSNPDRVQSMKESFGELNPNKKLVLVTGHRRENFGDNLKQMCLALSDLARRDDVEIVFPVHLNPQVREPVERMLKDSQNVHLLSPQKYSKFVYLMQRCTLILTDSGGIQEEAPTLGKPVLVLRDTSERPEAIAAGTSRLVKLNRSSIVKEASLLLDDRSIYDQMSRKENPFGDGTASHKIVDDLLAHQVH